MVVRRSALLVSQEISRDVIFFLSLTLVLATKAAFQRYVSLQMSMNISKKWRVMSNFVLIS